MNDQQEREAFEAWFTGAGFAKFKDTAWAAWEARAALAATPAPAPQAKPLTTEQTAKLFAEVNSLMPGLDTPEEMFATIVRFVEREHGIGQGKEASNG